jgi:hypothetical protein
MSGSECVSTNPWLALVVTAGLTISTSQQVSLWLQVICRRVTNLAPTSSDPRRLDSPCFLQPSQQGANPHGRSLGRSTRSRGRLEHGQDRRRSHSRAGCSTHRCVGVDQSRLVLANCIFYEKHAQYSRIRQRIDFMAMFTIQHDPSFTARSL